MVNPSGPDRDDKSRAAGPGPYTDRVEQPARTEPDPTTEVMAVPAPDGDTDSAQLPDKPPERRFTAPGFDHKETEVIQTAPEGATEIIRTQPGPPEPAEPVSKPPRTAMPQLIPPRLGAKLRSSSQRSWGWVLALILIILALTAIAVLGTAVLTRHSKPKASQEDQVRTTIHDFDVAVQTGNLAALRGITCGTARDGYLNYDEHDWQDTYRRVAAAKQFPVVASIDQVVVNGEHAEANVTAFLAYAPQVRSARSFDLQFRDDQWKICQSFNS